METEKQIQTGKMKLEPIKKENYEKRNTNFLKELVEKKKVKHESEKLTRKRLEKITLINLKNVGVLEIQSKVKIENSNIEPDSNKSITNNIMFRETANNTVPNLKRKKKKNKKGDKIKLTKILPKEKIIQFKNCYTLEDWKRKSNLDPESKVFICCPGYPDMRKGLLARGFVENRDTSSKFFDIKITMGSKDIDFDKLVKGQVVNHFIGMGEYTRKVMLAKNLQNLLWVRNVDINTFFPRVYDLTNNYEVDAFYEDFKLTLVESILKEYVNEGGNDNNTFPEQVVKVCITIAERRFKSLDEIIDSPKDVIAIYNKEWEIINDKYVNSKPEGLLKKTKSLPLPDIKVGEKSTTNVEYKDKVVELLNRLKERSPQYNMNGNKNIWILKPSGLSRGRGIRCIDNLEEIQHIIKSGSNQYIIQKYIENPMIINRRKFDIRQWVLVTDFNPLTIWQYDAPYIRFSGENYNLIIFQTYIVI
jgi:tubulin monoglycylase TTLL3/8